jgi:hypothetical protein
MIEEFHSAVDTSHLGMSFPVEVKHKRATGPPKGESFGVLRCQERVVLFKGAIVTCRRPSPRPKPWAPGALKMGESALFGKPEVGCGDHKLYPNLNLT